ncbi:hypothetical protein BGZ76_007352, partial [Entomortierella beljakovae]
MSEDLLKKATDKGYSLSNPNVVNQADICALHKIGEILIGMGSKLRNFNIVPQGMIDNTLLSIFDANDNNSDGN